ncbi:MULTISPECIES: ABC transporter permease [Halorussus]|uniref:ABC transporter permease n=1 Tax=Halorussus TaxID=1070314 RepID=UPI000E2190A5|nr:MULTISPECIES: ABC transporter permease [Halorussus]NHN60189.1 ABC transporter permease [Halorussus sp. JP-T4]
MTSRRGAALALAVLAAMFVVAWLVRPWLHGPLAAAYTYPAIIEALAILAVGGYLSLRLLAPDRSALEAFVAAMSESGQAELTFSGVPARRQLLGVAVGVLTVLLAVGVGVLGGAYAQEHVSQTLSVEETQGLPGVDATRPRVLPRSVARQYAENSLQYPRYRLAEGDIAIRNGTPVWSFGLAPDGGVNSLLLTGQGASFVDMTTQRKRVDVVEETPTVGFGYGLGRGGGVVSQYRWKLLKGQFWVQYGDPMMVEHDGDVYIAVPYKEYDHHVRLTPLPVVYATPEWGGVALVAPDGEISHLSPDEARNDPVLADQRLYPFDLARYYVESMRYRNGIVNKWFVHEDELEVAPVPGEGNDQPFLVLTEDRGIQYFVAAEPYGDAQGIFQLWTFDGRTGEAGRYRLPSDSSLMGPRKAANYVRKANDRTDWDRFTPSEPVPAVIDETLYWQVRVVPSDSSGIAYTAFVDADSGDVYTFDTDEDVRAFLGGDLASDRQDREPTDDGSVVVITIRDANGDVVNTVEVTEGQSIEIAYGNETAANDSGG